MDKDKIAWKPDYLYVGEKLNGAAYLSADLNGMYCGANPVPYLALSALPWFIRIFYKYRFHTCRGHNNG